MVIGIVQCRPASGVFATRPRRVLPENREAGLVEIPRRTGSTKGIAHVWNKCPLPAFYITRGGMSLCVRANRYALAKASGAPLPGDQLALHGCDIPCVCG
jgi:hypothetical protein